MTAEAKCTDGNMLGPTKITPNLASSIERQLVPIYNTAQMDCSDNIRMLINLTEMSMYYHCHYELVLVQSIYLQYKRYQKWHKYNFNS